MGCGGSKADEPSGAEAAAEDVKPVVDDQVPDLPLTSPKDSRKKSLQAGKRRVGVSAEATNETPRSYVKTVIEKSPEVKTRIQEATATNALFAGLTEEQKSDVVDAMFEVPCTPGKDVITQGDVGDNFYVCDSGEYEVYLKQTGDKAVHTYKAGGCFGDLALMYNCPRAATVRCSVAGSLWGAPVLSKRAASEAAAPWAAACPGTRPLSPPCRAPGRGEPVTPPAPLPRRAAQASTASPSARS